MNTLKQMNKGSLIILGVILVLILFGVSIYSFTRNTNVSENKTTQTNPKITPVPLRISFEPPIIKLVNKTENSIKSDIKIDAGQIDLRSIEIVVLCDPKRIKNLTITQKRDRYSALSYAFADTQAVVNQQTCEGTLVLEIPADAAEQPGAGIVAELTATVLGSAPSDIVILPQSTGTTDDPSLQFQTQRVNLELTP